MTLVVDDVRLAHAPDRRVSVVCDGGRIVAIEAAGTVPDGGADTEHLDGRGALALPGLVDAHAHVDKTLYSGPWVPTPSLGTVSERIARERRERERFGLPREEYISALVERMVANGTTRIRTHTDVDPGVGLRGIETVARVAERYRDVVTIEQVAFPQGGLISNPGTLELLEQAVALGVPTIGGIDPAVVDRAPTVQLDALFDLAARTGCGIDIHLHEDGSLGAWEFEEIATRTIAYGMAGRVVISHAFGIAHPPTQERLIARLAEAGVALATAAVYDVPVPPLLALDAAGVPLACGSDGIRDLWGPFGDGDMLRRAMLVAYRNSVRTDEGLELALRAATTGGAGVLGVQDHGLDVGCVADLVLVDARNAAEAVASVPPRRVVVSRGRVVAMDGTLTAKV
ncbi:amidohydrolase [Microbacterium capsulatum]|uniref:Amidohydrolase n=1 Tax=Microbacterium capsulatum TaxID=3041921 RepID=A0ABU0XL48_9MICO|nr:amidohydrolase [Microbacterium sp. ASV81]MDQ4215849.1 amidohydrolase [Microbacterium sp. ASV81]